MTYYGAKEMAASFRTVRNNTIQLAEEIDEKHYGFQATPETRTVAQTLIHIANSVRFPLAAHRDHKLTTFVGFDFMSMMGPIMAMEQQPHTKAEIIAMLKASRDEFGAFLDGLTDDVLAQTVDQMPGAQPPSKTRMELILAAKEHEMHHRAQVMLMFRMLGGVPHMTRAMQERMAQMQAAQAAKK
jgi:uncharacterized damage-inducible protein DinB